MDGAAISNIPILSQTKMERSSSIGGYTLETTDSTPASSSKSEKNIEPVGRNDIQVEMAMLMMQRMKKEGRQPHFPSASSLASSIWSSSGGNSVSGSEDSESYAWSTSLHSGSEDDSEFSSSYSDSDVELSSAEEDEGDKVPPLPEKKYPQPPSGMMEGLPLGMGGLPLSLESLKRDLEQVGRAILASNAGEIAAERAQTLASINWLASHVPNAVLDQLGHETRALVAEEKAGTVASDGDSQDSRVASVVESDAMSDVSDLSNEHLNEEEFETGPISTADAANATHSYGDLATYTQPQGNTIPRRPPSNIRSSNTNGDPAITEAHSPKKGILEMLPQARGESVLPNGSPGMLSPNSSTAHHFQSRKSKGVKGLFKRLVKRKGIPKGLMSNLENPSLEFNESHPQFEGHDDLMEEDEMSQSIEEYSQRSGSLAPSISLTKETDTKRKIRGKRLPYSSEYRCALLFVDISGFTKLSTKLDPESLSKVRTTTKLELAGYLSLNFSLGYQLVFPTHCKCGARSQR